MIEIEQLVGMNVKTMCSVQWNNYWSLLVVTV